MVWRFCSLFNCSISERYWGGFQFRSITDKAARNIHAQVFVWTCLHFIGISNQRYHFWDIYFPVSLYKKLSNHFPEWLYYFTSSPEGNEWSSLCIPAGIRWHYFSSAAAAAKSLQLCPTLCDPIEGNPPGPCPWDSPGRHTGVGCHFLLQRMKVKSESEVAQKCPNPSDPMDYSLPGSFVHGICQASVLEWGAIVFSEWLYSSILLYLVECLVIFPTFCLSSHYLLH